jgi:RimJ/RimL family protein N-acetyltransferase
MKIASNTLYIPFMAKAVDYTPSPLAQCIMCVEEDGRPVAGVLYDCYNGQTIHAHIWVDAEKLPSREWYCAIFDYPFHRLKIKKIVGQVKSSNSQAISLDEHFGFEREAEVTDYYDDGASLLVYTMTYEQCRILNSKAWAKVRAIVARM